MWDTLSVKCLSNRWKKVIRNSVSNFLLGSIPGLDTEFNIGVPDDKYITKYVRTCTFEQEVRKRRWPIR